MVVLAVDSGGSLGRALFLTVEVDLWQWRRRTTVAGGGGVRMRWRKKGAIHTIALRAGWSVARRGLATGAAILRTVPPTPRHPHIVSIKYSPKQLSPSPLRTAARGGLEGDVKGGSNSGGDRSSGSGGGQQRSIFSKTTTVCVAE